MDTWEIIGEVDTVALKDSYGEKWKGVCLTPPFHVYANSRPEAEKIAREIIDPLQLCTMVITAELVPVLPSPALQLLSGELESAIEALNGDSNDDEHDALFSMAKTVAKILGLDLYKMLEIPDRS